MPPSAPWCRAQRDGLPRCRRCRRASVTLSWIELLPDTRRAGPTDHRAAHHAGDVNPAAAAVHRAVQNLTATRPALNVPVMVCAAVLVRKSDALVPVSAEMSMPLDGRRRRDVIDDQRWIRRTGGGVACGVEQLDGDAPPAAMAACSSALVGVPSEVVKVTEVSPPAILLSVPLQNAVDIKPALPPVA